MEAQKYLQDYVKDEVTGEIKENPCKIASIEQLRLAINLDDIVGKLAQSEFDEQEAISFKKEVKGRIRVLRHMDSQTELNPVIQNEQSTMNNSSNSLSNSL